MMWLILSVLFSVKLCIAEFTLTILHTNDIHARIEQVNKYSSFCSPNDAKEDKCFGGMPRLKTKIDQLKAMYPNSLLLDAGDEFQGTMWYIEFGGTVIARFMEHLRYDAMALGNHEFDNGVAGLEPFVSNVSFPVLSANADFSKTPKLEGKIQKSAVVTVGGQKIGIVGYTTHTTAYVSKPETVSFEQEAGAIQEEVDKLTSQGINKIIALGHSGYAADLTNARILTNVDVIVGGHTNTFLYNGKAPSVEKPEAVYPTIVRNNEKGNVLVVQDYAFGKYLGELHVTFDDSGVISEYSGNPVLLDKTVPRDNDTLSMIAEYQPRFESFRTEVVGYSHVHLDNNKRFCRSGECALGNLIADALVIQNIRNADSVRWSDISVAFLNGGALRTPITTGKITVEDVINVLPFGNTVDIIEITGQTLLNVFEFVAERAIAEPGDFGGFLQVSGLKVTYDLRNPRGARVVSMLVRCSQCLTPKFETLNVTKAYKVIANAFLTSGGDGFTVLKNNILLKHVIGSRQVDLALEYIKAFSPITMGTEGRIIMLGDEDSEMFCPKKVYCAALSDSALCSLSLCLIFNIISISFLITRLF